jgi:anti-sigma factor RsiW
MSGTSREDENLTRALSAVRAEPDDRALRLALDRLKSRERVPAWLAWTLRPAALAAAAGLLVVSVGASVFWVATTMERTSLTEQALDSVGTLNIADLDPGATTGAAADSGAMQ